MVDLDELFLSGYSLSFYIKSEESPFEKSFIRNSAPDYLFHINGLTGIIPLESKNRFMLDERIFHSFNLNVGDLFLSVVNAEFVGGRL